MPEIIEVLINGETVYFEDDTEVSREVENVGGIGEVGKQAVGAFQKALETIGLVVESTVQHVRQFDKAIAPDEYQIKFGVKISGEYGAVVTKIGGEAQLEITMTFKHEKM